MTTPSEYLSRQGNPKFSNPYLSIIQGLLAHINFIATDIPRSEEDGGVTLLALRDDMANLDAYLVELALAGLFFPMVVMVQRSVALRSPSLPILMYNKDRSLMAEITLNDPALYTMLGDDLNVLVRVRIWCDGTLQVLGRAPDQEW
jgi:hypothetical protein